MIQGSSSEYAHRDGLSENGTNVPPGALVRPKDPLEYYRKLRFHQSVESVRDYGLTQPGFVA